MINVERLRNLLTDMINIYSPSGKEEEIINFLKDFLKKYNIDFVYQEVEDSRGNILVLPEEGECDLVFVGHIDTVPAFDYENYEADIYDDEIYGLGSADMKGGCAAMIEAFLTYREKNKSDFPCSLALVVGEEESGDGAFELAREYSFDWAIIGEPTSLNPCFGHYGYVEMSLVTYGQKLHASISKPDKNAVKLMMDCLNLIINYIDKKGDILYNIRDFNSSQAGFASPDRCEAYLDLHLPTKYPIGTLTFEIEELIYSKFNDKEIKFSLETIHHGYELSEKAYLPKQLKKIYNEQNIDFTPSLFKSDSDAPILWQSGIKPIILGPGDLSSAHTGDEYVNFTEVVKASNIYYSVMEGEK
ncbi:M20 family metallopeptidase [Deferribacter autotrophicus]|uniref:M20 family metallopeptidase n=1 Tax=Deferribacter autotrophicus TaxID=500465 RepID=A0A5A8F1C3_9BACT|nr:M20/M25/M40 family metallo-hydrolase [Deferribacter autotrophicus]KAA0257069.1 M20 family metallopeptidase [Deferribacter autotrophicus]